MRKEMTCIVCPIGCSIEVRYNSAKGICTRIISVTGNTCPRGEAYARSEMTNPVRMLTSTVKIRNGLYRRLPVILSAPIPKGKMLEVMEAVNRIEVTAPIKINDMILENVCGLAVNVIASRSMNCAEGSPCG